MRLAEKSTSFQSKVQLLSGKIEKSTNYSVYNCGIKILVFTEAA